MIEGHGVAEEVTEVVPAALDGERVDKVVAMLTGLARSDVASLVAGGAVRLDGRAVGARSRRVSHGETLQVTKPEFIEPVGLVADPGVYFSVVFADETVIVVDKPAGLVVHPGAGQAAGTLVGGLLARFPDLADMIEPAAKDRPGIVHRLDKGTSGLLVVARSPAARRSLTSQLAARAAERRYRALVWGQMGSDTGLIDAPIRRADADPTRMAVRAGGREARTRYRVEQRFSVPVGATLVACRLETGRTHQIRVHLSAIGHAVVGDNRYDRHGRWPDALPRLASGRVWLHAERLSFDHPATGERVSFASPLPRDLVAVLAAFA
jgi:23S rRNA pseudouridine1911/1915/1917 synthase